MADRYTDEQLRQVVLARRGDRLKREAALLDEAKLRADECLSARKQWYAQLESDRDFMQDQFTDLQRSWRRTTERPVVEIHLMHTRIEEVLHDWRASEASFRIGSATSAGGVDAARMFDGIARRDQRDGNFDLVMHQVIEDSVSWGEGWGKVTAVKQRGRLPVESERIWDGRDWSAKGVLGMLDRDLTFTHVSPEDVWPDPHAVEADRSDMEWLIETQWISREKRDARWPNARAIDTSSFSAPDSRMRRWFTRSGPMRDEMVRIALYWRRRWDEQDYLWLPDWPEPVLRDGLTAEQQAMVEAFPDDVVVERERVPIVELTVLDGENVLAGPVRQPITRIPYFRACAKEIRYENGELVPRGLVAVLRGPAKWMSVTASDLAWRQSTAGIRRIVADPQAISGHEVDWANQGNPTSILLAHEYERFPSEGGQRKPLRTPSYMQANLGLAEDVGVIQTISDLMNTVGGSADVAARVGSEAARSGAAMGGVNQMEARNRSRNIYEAEKNTVVAAGRIWLDWRRTYSRTGRRMWVASETPGDPDEGIIVGVPFWRDKQSGEPVEWPWVPAHVDRIPLPPRLPDGTWVPPMFQVPGGATPPGQGAPPGVLPGAGAAPPVQPTVKIHRFNPLSDRVKVTTFSTGMLRVGAEAKTQVLQGLLPAAGPATPAMLKSAVKALSSILPMDDVVDALDAVDPTPPNLDDMDVDQLASHLRAALGRIQGLEEQLQQAAQAADATQAAREIEQLKASQRDATAKAVAEIRADAAQTIAQLRAETQELIARLNVDQRREEVFVEHSTAAQTASDREESRAAVAGMEAGARLAGEGARNGGRDQGPAGG